MPAVNIAALAQLCFRCGINGCAKRVDKIEAFFLKRADILAEQRQHKCFLRLEHFQAEQKDPSETDPDQPEDKQRDNSAASAENQKYNCCKITYDSEQQNGHTVLFAGQYFFSHV